MSGNAFPRRAHAARQDGGLRVLCAWIMRVLCVLVSCLFERRKLQSNNYSIITLEQLRFTASLVTLDRVLASSYLLYIIVQRRTCIVLRCLHMIGTGS